MSSGVFAVARSVFDHEFFEDEPFTEREAWVWLISEAAWRARRARAGKVMVDLSRGQCAFSMRFMAARWQWSKSRVGRFLDRLKTEAMIGTVTDHTITVITICKYNEYQKVGLPTGTDTGTPSGTEAGQRRDKLEEGETLKKEVKEGGAEAQTDFAFIGKIIRLKAPQYERWRKSYPGVNDMVAELTKADDYYFENPPGDGKWFFKVSKWLEKSHREATAPRISAQEADLERLCERLNVEAHKPLSPEERALWLANGWS